MAPFPDRPDVLIDSDEVVWAGRFPLQLVRFRHRKFDGALSGQRTWELWRRGRAAAVLPYDPWRDEVVLIEQFRLPALAAGVEPVMTEVPAGLCDGEEDAEATARREVGEEAGVEVDLISHVGDFVLSPGGSDERCTLFVGRVRLGDDAPAGGGGLASEHEDIRILRLPAPGAVSRALAGAYPNSVTTLALLWLAAKRDHLRAEWTAT